MFGKRQPSPGNLCPNHRVPVWEAGEGAGAEAPQGWTWTHWPEPVWERPGLREAGVRIRTAGLREQVLCVGQEGKPPGRAAP